MICVLHQVLLVDIVEAPVGRGLLLHGEGGVGRGYLWVIVGNIMVTINHLRVILGHLIASLSLYYRSPWGLYRAGVPAPWRGWSMAGERGCPQTPGGSPAGTRLGGPGHWARL